MIIYTAKFSKRKAIAILLTLALIISAVILMLPDKAEAVEQTAKTIGSIKTNDDRVAYLQSLGYMVSSQPEGEKTVTIPKEFDAVYIRYNEVQKEGGFDLEPYKAKRVTLYTYNIPDYDGLPNVKAELIIYKDRIIGGDIFTVNLDGFMHGLIKIN